MQLHRYTIRQNIHTHEKKKLKIKGDYASKMSLKGKVLSAKSEDLSLMLEVEEKN